MVGWLVGWLDGWIVGWFDGWTVGLLDGWTDGLIAIYDTSFSLSGRKALKIPKSHNIWSFYDGGPMYCIIFTCVKSVKSQLLIIYSLLLSSLLLFFSFFFLLFLFFSLFSLSFLSPSLV